MSEPVYKKAKLPFADRAAFIDAFCRHVSKGGIFLPRLEPQPKGTVVRFELLLRDGTAVLRGEGEVIWAKPKDPDNPKKAFGMGLKFTKLDKDSRTLVLEMVQRKESSEGGGYKPDDGQPSKGTSETDEDRESPAASAVHVDGIDAEGRLTPAQRWWAEQLDRESAPPGTEPSHGGGDEAAVPDLDMDIDLKLDDE